MKIISRKIGMLVYLSKYIRPGRYNVVLTLSFKKSNERQPFKC